MRPVNTLFTTLKRSELSEHIAVVSSAEALTSSLVEERLLLLSTIIVFVSLKSFVLSLISEDLSFKSYKPLRICEKFSAMS